MTAPLLAALLLAASVEGEWRSYTRADFVNDVCGNDTTIYLATMGGVAVVDATADPVRGVRTLVNTDNLPVNRCVCVALDSERNLWVGTEGGGVAVVPAESSTAVPYRPSDLPLRVRAILVDGRLVLAGTEEGLYVIDTKGTLTEFEDDSVHQYAYVRNPELLSDRILSLASGDGYWIGTSRGAVHVDSSFQHWVPYRRPLGDSVRAIALRGGGVVVGTELGLAQSDSAGFHPLVVFDAPRMVNDVATREQDVYVALSDGLYKVDTTDTNGMHLLHETDARSILMTGTTWLGCGGDERWGNGLHYLRSGQSWQEYYGYGLLSYNVNDLTVGPSGDVYACHEASGMTRIRAGGDWIEHLWGPAPNAVMTRVDSRGRAWFVHFASDGGMTMFNPDSYSFTRYRWGENSDWNIIQAFGLDRHDTKWLFNRAAVVVAVDSTGRQSAFSFPELVSPPGGNYEFDFDSRGRAWLGLTVGLEMIDYGGTLHDPSDDRHELHAAGLPFAEVRSVAVDAQDRVWVATPQGAAVWDGAGFQAYTSANTHGRLLSDNLFRVRVDAADRVWFLSERGLSVLDLVSNQWQSFTSQSSGLIGNPLGISGFYTGLDIGNARNEVVVGTRRGLSLFRLDTRPDTGAVELSVFPNPCLVGVHERVAIGNLPADATVRIYTLSGQPVADLRTDGLGRATWRPEGVASGVYVFLVTSSRGTRTGRVAVVGR